jgi:RNA polymerase sigma-70 factor, ECF subfamily
MIENEPTLSQAEESRLIDRAQQGDRPAFATLVDAYWERLYRWLYHLTHHRHSAEDLVQETFLKSFAALGSFRPGSNFKAWLFRIAYNGFVNQWRALDRVRQPFPQHLPDREENPLDQVLTREALQLLTRAVGRLPDDYRAAFLLRAEEGLSFREIGVVIGVTEETARWRVFKARQKLVNVLAPQLDGERV